jgi:hypothetical protein
MLEGRVEFIGKTVARTAGSVPQRVSTLDHKVLLDPVKGEPVVEGLAPGSVHLALRQGNKIADRERHLLVFQAKDNIPPVGGQPGKKPVPQIPIPPGAGCKSRQGHGQTYQYPPPQEKSNKRNFYYCHSSLYNGKPIKEKGARHRKTGLLRLLKRKKKNHGPSRTLTSDLWSAVV